MLGKTGGFNEVISLIESLGSGIASGHPQKNIPVTLLSHTVDAVIQNNSAIPAVLVLRRYNNIADIFPFRNISTH